VYPCEPGQPTEMAKGPNYIADAWGTFTNPVIKRAFSGLGTATLRGGVNVANLKYFC
jgi:hypothetical protein